MRRRILVIVLLLVLAGGAWWAWHTWTARGRGTNTTTNTNETTSVSPVSYGAIPVTITTHDLVTRKPVPHVPLRVTWFEKIALPTSVHLQTDETGKASVNLPTLASIEVSVDNSQGSTWSGGASGLTTAGPLTIDVLTSVTVQ